MSEQMPEVVTGEVQRFKDDSRTGLVSRLEEALSLLKRWADKQEWPSDFVPCAECDHLECATMRIMKGE